MQGIASCVTLDMFETKDGSPPILHRNANMDEVEPEKNEALHGCWQDIQRIVPPGFSIDSNLVRHLSFNEAHDWFDISNNDIPRELKNVADYIKRLTLIEYIESLHPSVARVTETVLNGDLDAALKTVFASLDSQIRSLLGAKHAESTFSLIGKAFNDGTLVAPNKENNDAVRSFLQGVIGYYRNNIVHLPLPAHRDRVEASLSLFGLAHESFRLLDLCYRK